MFERFSERARRVMVLSQEEARVLGDYFIGTEHLLLGLIQEEGIAARALERLGVSYEVVKGKIEGNHSGLMRAERAWVHHGARERV